MDVKKERTLMNRYMTYDELFYKIYDEGKIVRTKDLMMTELIDCNLVVERYNLYYHYLYRPFDKVFNYLFGELCWYFSGENTIKSILKYSSFWKKIRNRNNTINSNYGHLAFYKKNRHGMSQFEWTTLQLSKDTNSRQSVMLYNDKNYYYENNMDFVCTQLQHFLVRDNKLVSIVYVRSSDVILGLTYDIPWWSIVQQMVFFKLRKKYPTLTLGKMFVHGGSFHYYPNKIQLFNDVIRNNKKLNKANVSLKKEIPLGRKFQWYEKNILKYLDIYQCRDNLNIS